MPPTVIELRGFSVEAVARSARSVELRLRGEVAFDQAPERWSQLRRHLGRSRRNRSIDFELSGVTELDAATAALLVHARLELRRRGVGQGRKRREDCLRRAFSTHAGGLQCPMKPH